MKPSPNEAYERMPEDRPNPETFSKETPETDAWYWTWDSSIGRYRLFDGKTEGDYLQAADLEKRLRETELLLSATPANARAVAEAYLSHCEMHGVDPHEDRREEAKAILATLPEAPQPASARSEPVAWFRLENGMRVYYETEAWPDMTPLYTAPLSETAKNGWSNPVVMKINEAIQRGLKHEFFHDGLSADLHEMGAPEAYIEGWRDAWLEMADDLKNAASLGGN